MTEMNINSENLKYILGKKLRNIRRGKGLMLNELAVITKLSVSYLSEIENGKKYPKPDKMLALANALGIPFDNLVSMEVDEDLDPLKEIMSSPFLSEFPLDLFGISLNEVLNIITESPEKAGAFIHALGEISQMYDMRVEHLLFAALRSYQKIHLNYFEEIEKKAIEFKNEYKLQNKKNLEYDHLRDILIKDFDYSIEESTFGEYPELSGIRSIFVKKQTCKLLLNKRLLEPQKKFLLGKEIGFCYLNLNERPLTSPSLGRESFDQILSNFNASYFSGALLIDAVKIIKDMRKFFGYSKWDGDKFLELMKKFHTTPEMFIYRLGNLVPKHLGLENVQYIRFNKKSGSTTIDLKKEFNMSPGFSPRSIGANEHFCNRWIAVKLLHDFPQNRGGKEGDKISIGVQRSKFVEKNLDFFTITVVRYLSLNPDTKSSMTMSFLIDEKFKKLVKFYKDPSIPVIKVNETCERCSLGSEECAVRAAEPFINENLRHQKERKLELDKLINDILC